MIEHASTDKKPATNDLFIEFNVLKEKQENLKNQNKRNFKFIYRLKKNMELLPN